MEKQNDVGGNAKEEVNDEDGYKKSPIISRRVKRRHKLEEHESQWMIPATPPKETPLRLRKNRTTLDFYKHEEEQQQQEEEEMIPATPPKERPLRRLRKNTTTS